MNKTGQAIGTQNASPEFIGKEEQLQSKVISFLRFPLIVAVVFIHSQPHEVIIGGISLVDSNNLNTYTYVNFLISGVIARVAVPLFFFISGFLFFKGVLTLNLIKENSKNVVLHFSYPIFSGILLQWLYFICFRPLCQI